MTFLTTAEGLNYALGRSGPSTQPSSSVGLSGRGPKVQSETPDIRKVLGTEFHGILKLGRNLRDFLVHYLHFIIRKTGQRKFGHLAKVTQDVRPDPEFSSQGF